MIKFAADNKRICEHWTHIMHTKGLNSEKSQEFCESKLNRKVRFFSMRIWLLFFIANFDATFVVTQNTEAVNIQKYKPSNDTPWSTISFRLSENLAKVCTIDIYMREHTWFSIKRNRAVGVIQTHTLTHTFTRVYQHVDGYHTNTRAWMVSNSQ